MQLHSFGTPEVSGSDAVGLSKVSMHCIEETCPLTSAATGPIVCQIVDTNIIEVKFQVTHGTNHVFYYPGPVRWGFDEVRKKTGLFRGGTSQRLVTQTIKDSDVLWITCKYRSQAVNPIQLLGV